MATVLNQLARTNSLAASATNYGLLHGSHGDIVNGVESQRASTWRSGGVLSNLYINILTNDRNGSTFRTRKATANANLVVSITASTLGKFEDTSNTDTVTAGNNWHYSIVTGSTGTTFTYLVTSVLFAATTNTVQRAGAGFLNIVSASSTIYLSLHGRNAAEQTTESNVGVTYRTAGTLRNFAHFVTANARTTTTTLKTRINAVDGNQSVSIAGGATLGFEDTVNSDSIAINDIVNFSSTTGTGTETLGLNWTVTEFETTNNIAQYVVLAADSDSQTAGTTNYYAFQGRLAGDTTESDVLAESNLAFTASLLQINISANTIVLDSTLRIRINSANGNQIVTITALTSQVFQDTVNTDSIVATDTLDYQIVTPSTVTAITIRSISVLGDSSSGLTKSVSVLTMTSTLTTGIFLVNKPASSLSLTSSLPGSNRLVSKFPDALGLTSSLESIIKQVKVTPSALSLSAALIGVTSKVTVSPNVFELIFTLNDVTVDAGAGSPKTVIVGPLILTASLEAPAYQLTKSVDVQTLAAILADVLPNVKITPDSLALIAALNQTGQSSIVTAQAQEVTLTLTDSGKQITIPVSALSLDFVQNTVTLSGVDVVVKRRIGPKVVRFTDIVNIALNTKQHKTSLKVVDGEIAMFNKSQKTSLKDIEAKITNLKHEG